MMKNRIPLVIAAGLLASCGTQSDLSGKRASTADTTTAAAPSASHAFTINGYKKEIAQHIVQNSSSKVFDGRPQALLRSVIVMKYSVDAQGNLTHSEIMRSNHDHVTESIALASLRGASPFPKPPSTVLHRGRVDIMETWLFNDDGRFQLRTIAEPQMGE